MSPFRRKRLPVLWLYPEQVAVLSSLMGDLVELVGTAVESTTGDATEERSDLFAVLQASMDADAQTPEDPALRRLLPDAYSGPDVADAAEKSAEFRRLTGSTLRAGKAERALLVLESLSRVALDGKLELANEGEHLGWMMALADLRLVIASRLGIQTEDDARLIEHVLDEGAQEPHAWGDRAQLMVVYEWLGALQDHLVPRA